MSLVGHAQEFGPENMGYADSNSGIQVSWRDGIQTWHFPSGAWPDQTFAMVSKSTMPSLAGTTFAYANEPLEPGATRLEATVVQPARNVYRVASTAQTDAWYLLFASPGKLVWYAISTSGPGPDYVTAPAGSALGFQNLWPDGTGEPLTIPAGRFVRTRTDLG